MLTRLLTQHPPPRRSPPWTTATWCASPPTTSPWPWRAGWTAPAVGGAVGGRVGTCLPAWLHSWDACPPGACAGGGDAAAGSASACTRMPCRPAPAGRRGRQQPHPMLHLACLPGLSAGVNFASLGLSPRLIPAYLRAATSNDLVRMRVARGPWQAGKGGPRRSRSCAPLLAPPACARPAHGVRWASRPRPALAPALTLLPIARLRAQPAWIRRDFENCLTSQFKVGHLPNTVWGCRGAAGAAGLARGPALGRAVGPEGPGSGRLTSPPRRAVPLALPALLPQTWAQWTW